MYKESGGIYKVVWGGEHGDMIPKVIDMFSSNFHYCDFGYIDGSNGRWQGVTRSGYGASLYNGVAFFLRWRILGIQRDSYPVQRNYASYR